VRSSGGTVLASLPVAATAASSNPTPSTTVGYTARVRLPCGVVTIWAGMTQSEGPLQTGRAGCT
jgi:hypothetical protein